MVINFTMIHSMGLFVFAQTLRLHYWFSLSTTIGISSTGTYLLVFGHLSEYAVKSLRNSYSSGSISALLRLSVASMVMVFMLKAVSRLQMRRGFPCFRGLTHAERASRRVDERTPRSVIILVST